MYSHGGDYVFDHSMETASKLYTASCSSVLRMHRWLAVFDRQEMISMSMMVRIDTNHYDQADALCEVERDM